MTSAVYVGSEIGTAPGHSGECSTTFNVTDEDFSFHADVFRLGNASFMTCDKYFVILTKLDSALLHSQIHFSRHYPARD